MSRQRADVLGVFVKAPLAGQVKTRLAVELGAQRAAELYRHLGRSVVAACIGHSYDTVVWFTPVAARPIVHDWLAGLGVASYRAQPTGSLGRRMAGAVSGHFHDGVRRVVLIGSDCPTIDSSLVSRAFVFLEEHDLVIGPAQDGGYYLIGLRAPAPQLFRGISWSTDTVLEQTLLRARRLGLRPAILPTRRDIDTPGDARAMGLLSAR